MPPEWLPRRPLTHTRPLSRNNHSAPPMPPDGQTLPPPHLDPPRPVLHYSPDSTPLPTIPGMRGGWVFGAARHRSDGKWHRMTKARTGGRGRQGGGMGGHFPHPENYGVVRGGGGGAQATRRSRQSSAGSEEDEVDGDDWGWSGRIPCAIKVKWIRRSSQARWRGACTRSICGRLLSMTEQHAAISPGSAGAAAHPRPPSRSSKLTDLLNSSDHKPEK